MATSRDICCFLRIPRNDFVYMFFKFMLWSLALFSCIFHLNIFCHNYYDHISNFDWISVQPMEIQKKMGGAKEKNLQILDL